MIVCWPTRSRTGSSFVVNLTQSLYKWADISPQARINGFRQDNFRREEKTGEFRKMFMAGQGLDYMMKNNIMSCKYEDAGKDDFVFELAEAFPRLKFVASHRPLEMVLKSHFNIKSWGHEEADIIFNFSCGLYLYEKLWREGRLYLVDVTRRDRFKPELFLGFLGRTSTPEFEKIVKEWKPANTLEDQISRYTSEEQEIVDPPRLDRLREIHDWIPAAEARYEKMCNALPPLQQG